HAPPAPPIYPLSLHDALPILCFSPERVDPGNEKWHTKNTPKVVGGTTPRCLEAIQAMYGEVLEKLVPVTGTDAAEMVKLLENTLDRKSTRLNSSHDQNSYAVF